MLRPPRLRELDSRARPRTEVPTEGTVSKSAPFEALAPSITRLAKGCLLGGVKSQPLPRRFS